ncbi:MAG TPA: hypothetical protein VL283_03330 [Candidatus Baltobacteraceae bacterium]|nr:hypothetical protein [Candidatus Baltobacteraceae bacterium]
MKMTKKQVHKALKDLKTGLSIFLTVILLSQTAQPLQAQAQVQEGAGVAAVAAESAETATGPAVEESESAPTVQEKLLEVCEANESITDAPKCAKHLLGMVMTESEADASAVGDHGYARGWFQINSYYNPEVTKACAEDLECSATWTLNRLLKKGYLRSANWAIWCHNGCGINKYYVPKVLRKGAYQWDKPIALLTADEQRALASK